MPEPRTPKPEIPQPDLPEPEIPKPDLPEPEIPKPDLPEPEVPRPGRPEPEVPQPDLPPPEPAPGRPPDVVAAGSTWFAQHRRTQDEAISTFGRAHRDRPFSDPRRPLRFGSDIPR